MKVDKAVCTDTMTDAENAISYENLLSTLLQRKILAIKRDCEAKKVEKQRRKQQTCLGSLIFGKHHERSDGVGNVLTTITTNEFEAAATAAAQDGCGDGNSGGGVVVCKESSTTDVTVNVEIDDDNDDVCAGVGVGYSGKSIAADTDALCSSNTSISQQATVTDANISNLKEDEDDDEDKQASLSSSVYGDQIPVDAISMNFSHLNEIDAGWMDGMAPKTANEMENGDNKTMTTIQTVDTATHTDFNTEIVSIASSSCSSSSSTQMVESHELRKNPMESMPLPTSMKCDSDGGGTTATIKRDIESLSPTNAIIKSSPKTTTMTTHTMATGTSSKSSNIIRQIEVSDECNPKHSMRTSKNTSGSDTFGLATGIIKQTTSSAQSSIATAADASPLSLHDHEQQQRQHRQQISHLLEAKSISAQCSPIFTQRMPTITGEFIMFRFVQARAHARLAICRAYTLFDAHLCTHTHKTILIKLFAISGSYINC